MSYKIPVVGFVSLGCPKALVDTERIVTELRARGYRIGTSYHDADIVIVNTCGFVNEPSGKALTPSPRRSPKTAASSSAAASAAARRPTAATTC